MIWGAHLHIGYNCFYDLGYDRVFSENDQKLRDFLYFDRPAWDKVTEFLPTIGLNTVVVELAEGVKYDCAPELAVKGSLEKSEVRAMLQKLRALGLTPIPRLDFSAAHDEWLGEYSRMLATDEYRAFVKKLIAEVCELFDHPAYFDLGLADETYEAQKYYQYVLVRGRINYWKDVCAMCEACEENGARPIVSGEYYYREPYLFKNNLPKNAIVAAPFDGFVNPPMDAYGRDPRSERQKQFEELLDIDRDVLVISSGLTAFNTESLVAYVEKKQMKNLIGFVTSAGEATVDETDYFVMNDAYRLGHTKEFHFKEK